MYYCDLKLSFDSWRLNLVIELDRKNYFRNANAFDAELASQSSFPFPSNSFPRINYLFHFTTATPYELEFILELNLQLEQLSYLSPRIQDVCSLLPNTFKSRFLPVRGLGKHARSFNYAHTKEQSESSSCPIWRRFRGREHVDFSF